MWALALAVCAFLLSLTAVRGEVRTHSSSLMQRPVAGRRLPVTL